MADVKIDQVRKIYPGNVEAVKGVSIDHSACLLAPRVAASPRCSGWWPGWRPSPPAPAPSAGGS
jgi:hypothetical protein